MIPARQVGVLAASGVTMALVMSLLLIPALIYLRKPSVSLRQKKIVNGGFFNWLLSRLSSLNC